MYKKIALFIAAVLGLLITSYYFIFMFDPCVFRGGFGLTVIAGAKNPITGEIRSFPTPCNVPFGWQPYDTGGFLPN